VFQEAFKNACEAFRQAVDLMQRRQQLDIMKDELALREKDTELSELGKYIGSRVANYPGGMVQLSQDEPSLIQYYYRKIGVPDSGKALQDTQRGRLSPEQITQLLASHEMSAFAQGETQITRTKEITQAPAAAAAPAPKQVAAPRVEGEETPPTAFAPAGTVTPEVKLPKDKLPISRIANTTDPVMRYYGQLLLTMGDEAARERINLMLHPDRPDPKNVFTQTPKIPGLEMLTPSVLHNKWRAFEAELEKAGAPSQTPGVAPSPYSVDVGKVTAEGRWTTEPGEWKAGVSTTSVVKSLIEGRNYKGSDEAFLKQMWLINDPEKKYKTLESFMEALPSLTAQGIKVPGPGPNTMSSAILDAATPGKARFIEAQYDKVALSVTPLGAAKAAARVLGADKGRYAWMTDPEARHRAIAAIGAEKVLSTFIPEKFIEMKRLEESLGLMNVKLAELDIEARQIPISAALNQTQAEAELTLRKFQLASLMLQAEANISAATGTDDVAGELKVAIDFMGQLWKVHGNKLHNSRYVAELITNDKSGMTKAYYTLVLQALAKATGGSVGEVEEQAKGMPIFGWFAKTVAIPTYTSPTGQQMNMQEALKLSGSAQSTITDQGLMDEINQLLGQ